MEAFKQFNKPVVVKGGQPLPPCTCDECARKTILVQTSSLLGDCDFLPAAVAPAKEGGTRSTSQRQPLEELREELAVHARKAAQAPLNDDAMGDCFAIRKPNTKRPWLTYDADALLPNPFDAFLLGGGCRKIPWMKKESVEERMKVTLDLSLCYIIGCGRSGTTVLAELMSRYAGVVFLNEPRQLWVPLMPAMDIWSVAAPTRKGRLIFAPEEARMLAKGSDETVGDMIMDAYYSVAELAASPPMVAGQTTRPSLVVEKMPEHAFRLPFLAGMCRSHLGPGHCTFMHIIRDGVDTARSIAAFENPAAWYGVKDQWKWKCIQDLVLPPPGRGEAEPHCKLDLSDEFIAFLDLPTSDKRCRFARGLVEWAASVLSARKGSEQAADSQYLEIRYDELIAQGAMALSSLTSHLDLEPSASARQCAKETLAAKPSRSINSQEKEVLVALRGSQVEKLLREFGRELPH